MAKALASQLVTLLRWPHAGAERRSIHISVCNALVRNIWVLSRPPAVDRMVRSWGRCCTAKGR